MTGPAPANACAPDAGDLRIDRWLWHARFFKSRALATRLCAGGKLRVNRQLLAKPHYRVKPGDVLTFPQGRAIRVIRVVALGARRGPAPEAQALYEDLSPPQPVAADKRHRRPPPGERDVGTGRPTKSDRRALDRLRGVE